MAQAKKYEIIVSKHAQSMLGLHIRFLAEASVLVARKLNSNILASIRSLSRMPERNGFLYADGIPPNQYHKMLVGKWYLILYQIIAETVYVDYIVDCRQDTWLLE